MSETTRTPDSPELSDVPADETHPSEPAPEPKPEPAAEAEDAEQPVTIRAQDLTKHYGEFVALADVSFSVRKGTVAAFLGPNGAGKSTTMKILTGYLAPTSGRAELLGMGVTDSTKRLELSRRLGYLPENGPLYLDMTPSDLLDFVGQVRRMSPASLKKAKERVVDLCAISSVYHKPIQKLSKGFRQRVGMAQAILHDPEVLILDEPTSGLDPLQIRQVRSLIRELGKEKTLLISTHILREVEAVADRVVMISEGRIVFSGTVDDLRAEKTLEDRFYELAGDSEKEVA